MQNTLPNFEQIDLSCAIACLKTMLAENEAAIVQLLQQESPSWESLWQPLEDMEDQLEHFWGPITHLHGVMDSEDIRQVYNEAIPLLTDYATKLAHNKALFKAVQQLSENEQHLTQAQKKALEHDIRNFKLAGVDLPDAQKKQFAQLSQELSVLTTKFSENVLDATKAWHFHTENEADLEGLPAFAKAAAKALADEKQKTGWCLSLDIPIYLAVMQHAKNRELREAMYQAYCTRASDQGPNAGEFDNSQVMFDIMNKRRELAGLLGFKNYAEESLATKMAKSAQEVLEFLADLVRQAKPKAEQEFQALQAFAKAFDGCDDLQSWDVAYYSERCRETAYNLSQEELKPYFETTQVIQGLFAITEKLFGIQIKPFALSTWHESVTTYALYQDDSIIAYCYFDLFTRPVKRGGAWMAEAQARRLVNGQVQIPAAYVTCNFQPATAVEPSLLTHDDVLTLFHEFGHALQHMLTTVDVMAVSGINGVPWDAVEVASQFYENFAWQQEGLALIAKHYQTGAVLPDDLYQRMLSAKNYQAAMQLIRQLEFAVFDMILHIDFHPDDAEPIQYVLNEVREQVSVYPVPAYNRFQHGFSHIFAGGYAAGYYSYLWAEVMAADGFAAFLEQGVFNPIMAKKWRDCILAPGGSEDPGVLFERFRGRKAEITALLKDRGIIE